MNNKRILLIGNPCNMFSTTCKYLQDLGYDINLLLFSNELNHFLPEADLLNRKRPKYVQETTLSHYPSDFYNSKKDEVKKITENFDFIIGCGAAPAYLNLINVRIDLFIPSGSDLYFLPFYRGKRLLKQSFKKIVKMIYITYHQREGIRRAKNIMFPNTNFEIENCLKSLKIKNNRIKLSPPQIYYKEYEISNLKNYYKKNPTKNSVKFEKIRVQTDFIIFHHCRHSWKKNRNNIDYKGNEKLLKGFSQFLKKNKTINAKLILFEYGQDVEASKILIKKLNIEESIHWFPILERREIMYGISLSDLGVGEIGLSWLTYSTLLEFLCMSKPIIAYRDDHLYERSNQDLFEINNVSNSNDVFLSLDNYYTNQIKQKEIANKNFDWFIKYGVEASLNAITNLIEEKN